MKEKSKEENVIIEDKCKVDNKISLYLTISQIVFILFKFKNKL
jgi:hypothetical protein